MFFYGTLQDPQVLSSLLDLPFLPIRHPAKLTGTGIKMKMWRVYPVLIATQNVDTAEKCDSGSRYVPTPDSSTRLSPEPITGKL